MNRNSNLDNLPFSNKKLVNIAFIRGSGREFSPNCTFHCAQNEETIIIIIHTLKKKKKTPPLLEDTSIVSYFQFLLQQKQFSNYIINLDRHPLAQVGICVCIKTLISSHQPTLNYCVYFAIN